MSTVINQSTGQQRKVNVKLNVAEKKQPLPSKHPTTKATKDKPTSKESQEDIEMEHDMQDPMEMEEIEDIKLEDVDLQALVEEWKYKEPTTIPEEHFR